MPQLIVEVGFTLGASTSNYLQLGDTSRGLLGTGALAPDFVWTDVTAYVKSWNSRRGSTRVTGPILRYEAGTATIVFHDPDRRFDPENLAGPYVSAGITQVTPMRAVRIRAVWAGVTYNIWRGYADSWDVNWQDPNWSEVTLQATDAFKILTSYNRPAVAPVGAGEDSGARVARILDSVGFPATDRVIGVGSSTLQATTLAGDALAELQLTGDSELGEFWMDASGRAVFRSRHQLLQDARSSASQVTFGDGGGAELPYVDLTLSYDDTQLINYARIATSIGVEQDAQDSASIAHYLTHVYQRSDLLLQTDGDAAMFAAWLLYQSKDPERRFDAIALNPHADETHLFPQALGRELGDRITIVRRPPNGGSPITRDVFVRGIAHSWTPDNWLTTYVNQSATKYAFLLLDNATLGQLDNNALAY
jgi:hypothetical protein